MNKLGILVEFVNMTIMFFTSVIARIKVKGKVSKDFTIKRGVQQGDPLALYLFLVVAKMLNATIKH
jgi:hypothetical protein